MSILHTIFEANREIILFIYGLVFFVLGLAIALQSRRYSRLDLARSLTWLAAFGFTHGLHEWGDLFIPIQARYLNPTIIQFLNLSQLVLLAVSFTCLLEFGVALLRPSGRERLLHSVSAALLLLWVFFSFFVALPFVPDVSAWHHTANALARYFIAFPGGLLAAYGLRRQARERIAPLNVPHIVNTLRTSGIALLLYGLFGGLIPPPVSFFPGNLLNTATFEQWLGVPPPVFRSLIGLVLAITIIRALEVFDVETERFVEGLEQQQILAAERERIGRELHDGAIQTVYTAGLLVESAQKLADPDSPVAQRLEKAEAVLNDAIRDLRRNLGELRAPPSPEPLPAALQQLAADPRYRTLMDITLDLELADTDTLSPSRTGHVLALVSEALSNVARHARARNATLGATRNNGRLQVTIRDDGAGLPRDPQPGYGLRNMRDRARLLGGQLDITSSSGKGTLISLDIPWNEEV
nr:sensor histidine kinase [Chloroflexota bacterium]